MTSNIFIEGRLTDSDFILDSIDEEPIFADQFELDISGADGEDITISLVSTNDSFDPFLEVLDPITGQVIEFDDNSGRGDDAEINEDDDLEVPNDGKLIVRVTNSLFDPDLDDDENPYTLNISVDENDADIELNPKDTVFGDSTTDSFVILDGQINTNDFVFNLIDDDVTTISRADEYRLEAPDGENVNIALNGTNPDAFDPFLQVINADTGEVLADSDDDGNDVNAFIAPGLGDIDENGIPAELTIDDDIDYIIRVTSFDNFPLANQADTVDYQLEVSVPEGEVTVSPRIDSTSTDDDALTLTGGTAQIAYVAYYGRPADNGGLRFWNDVLGDNDISYSPRSGDLLTGDEQDTYNRIVNDFGNSDEADRTFGDISNRERVDQVYEFAFDRIAERDGSDFWTEQLDRGNITLANFALEVALGAQNDDIRVLNNKIDSADRFSESLDTNEERDAYVGSTAERFGRNWLDDFGDTVSTQAQVDSAIDDLVDG